MEIEILSAVFNRLYILFFMKLLQICEYAYFLRFCEAHFIVCIKGLKIRKFLEAIIRVFLLIS